MSGAILRFQRRNAKTGWTNQELAELQRVSRLLANAGLPIASEQGVSDEGDPWFIFLRTDIDDVVAHIARIDGLYVIAAAGDRSPTWGASFRGIADALIARQPLAVPKRHGSDLFTHPIAILAAFVATALVDTEPTRASKASDRLELSGPGSAKTGSGGAMARVESDLGSQPSTPSGETNLVAYAVVAVASALAFTLETDPAFAAHGTDESSESAFWEEPTRTTSDAIGRGPDGIDPAEIPDNLSPSPQDDLSPWQRSLTFGRLSQPGESEKAEAGVFSSEADASSSNTARAELQLAGTQNAANLVPEGEASGVGVAMFSPGIYLTDPAAAVARVAGQVPSPEGAQGSAYGAGAAHGSPPSSHSSDQGESGSNDRGDDQHERHYVDLVATIDGLEGGRDLDAGGQRDRQEASSGSTAAEEGQSVNASGPEEDQARQEDGRSGSDGPGSEKDREVLRDTDGDGVVGLTDAADLVLYDGGQLAVEGFEPGRDRLVMPDGSDLTAIAIDATTDGDLKLVFEHDLQSVTFVGVTLEDFAAL